MTLLPPGQRKVNGFPRFGTHLHHPPPVIPPNPAIRVVGAVRAPISVTLTELGALPQVERVADFHCVAGWSATGLRWAGVAFETFYRTLVEPVAPVTHVVFRGWDGFSSTVLLEDALAEDVLIATRLGGEPLGPDHGAPVRLVSPGQYGFVSTKHLKTIEVRTGKPRNEQRYTVLTRSHARARVWQEERHPWFPAAAVRPVYRSLIRPIAWLCRR